MRNRENNYVKIDLANMVIQKIEYTRLNNYSVAMDD